MKRSVIAAVLLFVAAFAGAAWAESIELPIYDQVFKKTTTATFDVPDGWTAELKEGAASWSLRGKIGGTPLEFSVGLQFLPNDKRDEKSRKDVSTQYTKNFGAANVVDHKNSGALWSFGVKGKEGNITSINYHWFVDGAEHFVTAMFTNSVSAIKESVDTKPKAAEIEKFLKSVKFSVADGEPKPTKTKVAPKSAEAPASGAADEYDPAEIAYLNELGLGAITADKEAVGKYLQWTGRPKQLKAIALAAYPDGAKSLTGDLDLSRFPKFTILQAGEGGLTSIKADSPEVLELVANNMPSLAKLTLGALPKLRKIEISGSAVDALDISKFPALTTVKAQKTKIAELDATALPKLRSIELRECDSLKTVTVKDCPEMSTIALSNTPIEEIVISGAMPKLAMFEVRNAPNIKAIDFSGAKIAGSVSVNNSNALASLNVAGQADLKKIFADNTALTELDLTGCSSLELLHIKGSQIKTINVKDCPKLTDDKIKCSDGVEIVR